MSKHHQGQSAEASGSAGASRPSVPAATPGTEENTLGNKALTVAAVGVAAALIEVELIPGMLLGVAAMLAPNFLPKLGNGLRPLIKSAVRAGYTVAERAKETVAEAGEHFQDIVAEVKAEHAPASESLNGRTAPSHPETT